MAGAMVHAANGYDDAGNAAGGELGDWPPGSGDLGLRFMVCDTGNDDAC